jgi:hypothetical protein
MGIARFLHFLLPLVCIACSGGGSTASESTPPGSDGLPPGSSCERDAGLSAALCAASPALAGCRMCLDVGSGTSGGRQLCEHACRLNGEDCPQGQTCTAQAGGSLSTQDCGTSGGPRLLGYCK